MKFWKIITLASISLLVYLPSAASKEAYADDMLKSGYHYSHPDTQAIQDDDFANPGLLYIDRGQQLWNMVQGKQNKSCETCHGKAGISMLGIGNTYPKLDQQQNGLINLGQRVQICRTRYMDAKPFLTPEHEHENEDLLSLELYIMAQSVGLPLSVKVSGSTTPYFEQGRKLYYQKIGQSDLACFQCHNENVGGFLRAERISQGHINGFPTYILRWDRIASIHRRFQFCNEQARAEPLPINHPDYNALQLYVAWRGGGLLIENPSVRR